MQSASRKIVNENMPNALPNRILRIHAVKSARHSCGMAFTFTWEFPKIGVPHLGGPYNKDPTI